MDKEVCMRETQCGVHEIGVVRMGGKCRGRKIMHMGEDNKEKGRTCEG
jgi:hypothetical protein